MGAALRIYEAGKKKLLRKCEHRRLPTHIATLSTSGDRIYVGDLQVPCIVPCFLPCSGMMPIDCPNSSLLHRLCSLASKACGGSVPDATLS